MPITQIITALPTPAPSRLTQTPDEFVSAMDNLLAALPTMVTQENTWASQANTLASDVNTNATSAATSAGNASSSASTATTQANNAIATAAFKGLWSSLSGSLNMPASVEYNGKIWILNTNTTNVAADVPGVSSKWTLFVPTSVAIAREVGIAAYPAMVGTPLAPSLDLHAQDYINEANGTHPDITFTRASNATAFDKNGKLITLSPNIQRHQYDPLTGEYLGWLIEEARTNLLTYSEDFSNAAWVPASNAVIVTANAAAAPDGATTADLLNDDSASVGLLSRQVVAVANDNATYTFSCFVKKGTSRYFALWLSFQGGTLRERVCTYDLDAGLSQLDASSPATRGTIENVGNGWFRVTITASNTTEGNTSLQCRIYPAISALGSVDPNATGSVYAWGAQLESGVSATSYIQTTTAQATRSTDSATMTGTIFSNWYNQSEGTFVREVAALPYSLYLNTPVETLTTKVNDGTDSNRISLRALNNLTSPSIDSVGLLSGAVQFDTAGIAYQAGVFAKQALAYKINDIGESINGGNVVSDVSANIPTVDRLHILNLGSGYLRRLTYFPRRLSSSHLQVLSS